MRGALAGLLALLATGAASAADYACRHVRVTDQASGRALSGIEDLAYHPPSRLLILSVHDRWGDMDGDPESVRGLYAASAVALGGADAAMAWRLNAPGAPPSRPHGLSLRRRAPGDWRLAVIDHRFYRRAEQAGAPGTVVQEFALTDGGELRLLRQVGHADLCPANDLDWLDDDRLIVSLDRDNCGGFRGFLELALAQWRGRLALLDLNGGGAPEILLDGLGFPNGVLVRDGRVLVAYSREGRVASYRLRAGRLTPLAGIAIDGGGDNMSFDAEGRILLAVHPSLTRFGLYSLQIPGFDSAPTRLLRLTPDLDSAETLFENGDGRPLSGVTGLVAVGDRLIGGAAFDKGLAVCAPDE